MFVELIEWLRCPNPHEPSALVASARVVEARHIMDGTLGCPVCRAEFRIERGVARFAEPASVPVHTEPSDDVAMRLAAFLEMTDAHGFVLLCGTWAAHAERLRRLTDTPLVFVNAAPDAPLDIAAAVLEVRDILPVADGSARAASLDADASADLTDSIVRAVRSGGRVAGPASLALPASVTEMARDDRMWVGTRRADPVPSPIVSLSRARR